MIGQWSEPLSGRLGPYLIPFKLYVRWVIMRVSKLPGFFSPPLILMSLWFIEHTLMYFALQKKEKRSLNSSAPFLQWFGCVILSYSAIHFVFAAELQIQSRQEMFSKMMDKATNFLFSNSCDALNLNPKNVESQTLSWVQNNSRAQPTLIHNPRGFHHWRIIWYQAA